MLGSVGHVMLVGAPQMKGVFSFACKEKVGESMKERKNTLSFNK